MILVKTNHPCLRVGCHISALEHSGNYRNTMEATIDQYEPTFSTLDPTSHVISS